MTELLEQYLPNVVGIQDRIIENIIETVYMTISAALIAGIFGDYLRNYSDRNVLKKYLREQTYLQHPR